MDINRLRYFSVVARTESLAKASEFLRISPAALSKAMTILEDELSSELFVRVGRGINLTDAAKALLPQIQKILESVDQLADPSLRLSPSDRVRVGSFEVFTTHFLKPLTEALGKDIALDLHELTPGKLEDALAADQVDYGITYIPVPHPQLEFIKVAHVTMGIFGRPGVFRNHKLENLPFAIPITPLHGNPNKVQGLDGWPDDQIPRRHAFRVTMMESALELCRQGVAVSYLPSFVIDLHNLKAKAEYQLKEVEIDVPRKVTTRYPVYLAKRKIRAEDQQERRIAAAIRKIL